MGDEYIKKEDAVKAVANAYWHGTDCDCYAFAHKALDNVQNADVAPVVRCKDCVYRVIMRDPLRKPMDCYGCKVMHYNEDDWFCSFGERKDDD